MDPKRSSILPEELVISDALGIAISATWMTDVIVRAAIEAIVKCEIDFHNGALACLEWNSLSGYCQVSSRSPLWHFMIRIVVWEDSKETAQLFHL